MKLNVNTQINLDDLEQAFRDMSQSMDGIDFNKEAIKIIDILAYRSANLGELKDLRDRVNKLFNRMMKYDE